MEEHIPQELIQPIIKTYPKGAYIYEAEESVLYIYFIAEGRIKIESINSTGRRMTKSLLSNGALFGEMALFGELKRKDYACALEITTLHIYDLEKIQKLLESDSKFQFLILRNMVNRVIDIEERMTSLVFNDSRSRVIQFLVQLGRKEGKRIGFDTLVRDFLPHQEIAYFTGSSRQTVNVVLNDLRSKNIVHYHRARLLIRDMDKLEEELNSYKASLL